MTVFEFTQTVLHRMYQDMHQIVRDNYAPERFSFDGVDRSNVFETGKHAFYLEWFVKNAEKIFGALNRLADQESRDLYVDILRYRLSGHLHVRINSRVPAQAASRQAFTSVFTGTPSPLVTAGQFGNLVHYDHDWAGVRYTVDTIKDALIYPLIYRQYYFERNGVVIQPEAGDHVIDGGACTGDTSVVFSRSVGPAGRVYAFDPIQNHIDICAYNFAHAGFRNFSMLPFGISDRSVDRPTVKLAAYNPGWRDTTGEMPLRRIDDLVMDRTIQRVDFIRVDVEGSELAALRGAQSTLYRFRPKLAISIYHQPDDAFQILDWIDQQQLGYRFYIDHHTIWDEETVLYAIAERPDRS